MRLFFELKYRIKRFMVPASIIFILIYPYYQMVTGERGLLVWYSLTHHIEELNQQNLALAGQLSYWDTQVSRLRIGSMDTDYADEMVRRNLPVVGMGEQIIYLNN